MNISFNPNSDLISLHTKSHIHAPSIQKNLTGAEQRSPNIYKDKDDLTPADQQEVEKLAKIDEEVKAHEEAHRRAGGHLANFPRFTQVKGPDGKDYTVQGEVVILNKEGNSPEENIAIARSIQRAALAPENPSSKDRQVALQAQRMEENARQEIIKREQEKYKNQSLIENGIYKQKQRTINMKPAIEPTFKSILGLSSKPPAIEASEPLIEPLHLKSNGTNSNDKLNRSSYKSIDLLA